MDDEQLRAAQADTLNLAHQIYDLKRQADLIAELPEHERRIAADIGQAHWHPEITKRVRAVIDPFGESLAKLRFDIVTSPDKEGSGWLARNIETAISLIEASLPSDRREQFTFGDRTEFSATETILRAAKDVCNILPDPTSPPEHKAAWQMLHGWILPTQKMTEAVIQEELQNIQPNQTTNTKKKAARTRRRKRTGGQKPQKLTAKQTEAVKLHGECEANIAEVGRRMGISRKTAEQHIKAGFKNLGISMPQKARTQKVKRGKRGEDDVAEGDDKRR